MKSYTRPNATLIALQAETLLTGSPMGKHDRATTAPQLTQEYYSSDWGEEDVE